MSEWIKIPLIDVTFVSATVTYKKKKGFFARLFNQNIVPCILYPVASLHSKYKEHEEI